MQDAGGDNALVWALDKKHSRVVNMLLDRQDLENVDILRQLEELSVTTNVCENEREPSVLMDKTGKKGSLRPIVIDGSNVAYCHGKDREFSPKGIDIVVDDFLSRGHERIVVFLPNQRGRSRHDRELLEKLEEKCSLSFAPSRQQPSGRYTQWPGLTVGSCPRCPQKISPPHPC